MGENGRSGYEKQDSFGSIIGGSMYFGRMFFKEDSAGKYGCREHAINGDGDRRDEYGAAYHRRISPNSGKPYSGAA